MTNACFSVTTIQTRRILRLLAPFLCVMLSVILPADAQSPSREQAVGFIQNAIATKALHGDCGGITSTYNPGVATQVGTLGAGTMSYGSMLSYELGTPFVDSNNVMHLTTYQIVLITGPGVIGGYYSSTGILSVAAITLSRISPDSISVISDSCGTGVKFSGTDNAAIGTLEKRTRSQMKGLLPLSEAQSRLQPACTEKEIKKNNCIDATYNLTDQIIYFPNDPTFASRFVNALKLLVIISGGQSSAF